MRGVIRFNQPILGVLCTVDHLRQSDSVFGTDSIVYATDTTPRGKEHGPYYESNVSKIGYPADFSPDEVILSQDRKALCINAYASPDGGYDQVRVLTLAPPIKSSD